MIDAHCHLDLFPDPERVIDQCRRTGTYVLAVTTTPKAWAGNKRLLRDCTRIQPALGLHPQLAHQRFHELQLFEELIIETKYVGEIGLDHAHDFNRYAAYQLKVFKEILQICASGGGRIMSIHSRGAVTEVLEQLEACPDSGTPILHWFTGNHRELKRAIELGCWFSVGPAMLMSKKGREIVSRIPRNRILTESDGPFAKLKRKSLSPLDVPKAVELLAQIWGETTQVAGKRLLDSFRNIVS